MKTVMKVAAGILLAAVLLIGGCAALIGGAATEVQKESDEAAITAEQYQSVGSDDTLDSVIAEFGEPSDRQDMEGSVPEGGEDLGITEGDVGNTCIYYNKPGEIISPYQFCFDGDGNYQSKASY